MRRKSFFHVFQIRGLPESRKAIKRIGEFSQSQLNIKLVPAKESKKVSIQNPKPLSMVPFVANLLKFKIRGLVASERHKPFTRILNCERTIPRNVCESLTTSLV